MTLLARLFIAFDAAAKILTRKERLL